ncbi:VOC family protein [Pokkaliibacter sp. MBI-7]|uniref:VOC family protein n=1 Tax=Pokkaliibacter sp. MBI-7 TaxID=3040600 RepID=UPI00244CE3D6|nr:VOC family protein [Pokkaliibacter sp. MBI-7]MDH2433066.1 VOC family protein [Pokkaliibacter sp. MBI-7]
MSQLCSGFTPSVLPALLSIRLISADIQRLVSFYARLTGIEPIWYTEDFAELRSAVATLAIGSTRTRAFFAEGQGIAGGQSHTAIIEFMVDSVDALFEAQRGWLETSVVQAPTTMPWGNRSLVLRDPDGHYVNVFTPVSAEAVHRFTDV